MTWQVEQAKLASHAPYNSTSLSFATCKMCIPFYAATSLVEPSRRMKLNFTLLKKKEVLKVTRSMTNCIIVNQSIFIYDHIQFYDIQKMY